MARPLTGPDDAVNGPDRGPEGKADESVAATEPTAGRGRHAAGRHASPPAPRSGWGWLLVAAREIALVLVIAIVLSVIVRVVIAQAFSVPSPSMEDTLQPGDRIVAAKILTRVSGVSRGEIIVFRDPGGWLPAPPDDAGPGPVRRVLTFLGLYPSDSGSDLVKRVIGVAGDRVACCDAQGRIVLNGAPLDEPYLKPGVRTDQVVFDVVVPRGGVFVMGDNRAESADSRYHLDVESGSVPVEEVIGRAVVVVWPFERATVLGVPESLASAPPAP